MFLIYKIEDLKPTLKKGNRKRWRKRRGCTRKQKDDNHNIGGDSSKPDKVKDFKLIKVQNVDKMANKLSLELVN